MDSRHWLGFGALAILLHSQPGSAALVEHYGRLPLHFEPNRGQADDRTQFLTRGPGYTLALSATEARVKLHNSRVFSLKLTAGNTQARMNGLETLPGRVNYILGNDPRKWVTAVATFARVQVEQAYPGV